MKKSSKLQAALIGDKTAKQAMTDLARRVKPLLPA